MSNYKKSIWSCNICNNVVLCILLYSYKVINLLADFFSIFKIFFKHRENRGSEHNNFISHIGNFESSECTQCLAVGLWFLWGVFCMCIADPKQTKAFRHRLSKFEILNVFVNQLSYSTTVLMHYHVCTLVGWAKILNYFRKSIKILNMIV